VDGGKSDQSNKPVAKNEKVEEKEDNQVSKKKSSDKNVAVDSDKKEDTSTQEVEGNSVTDISALKAEINSLKQQVEELSKQSKSNIEERIKFWQSMKEQAN